MRKRSPETQEQALSDRLKAKPMTIDEAMAEAYRQQGYLVVQTVLPEKVGAVNVASLGYGEQSITRLRVEGPATRAEHAAQRRLLTKLLDDQIDEGIGNFFYRVVAID